MSAPVVERPTPVGSMPMYAVLTVSGAILCRSRLLDVALPYLTPGAVLLRDGVPYSTR